MLRQNRYPSLRKQHSSNLLIYPVTLTRGCLLSAIPNKHFQGLFNEDNTRSNDTRSSTAIPVAKVSTDIPAHQWWWVFFCFFAFITVAYIKTRWKKQDDQHLALSKHCPYFLSRCDNSLQAQFHTIPKIYVWSRRLPPDWMVTFSKPPDLYFPGFPTYKMGKY